MKRWLPHMHRGGSTTDCQFEDGRRSGREGYYLEICWFGWMIGFTIASERWNEQWIRRWDAEPRLPQSTTLGDAP